MTGFYATLRAEFGPLKQGQVNGIEAILAASLHLPPMHRAYLLATAWHETARTMQPITEYGGRRYFDKYDTGRRAKALGNTPEADGDGYLFRGRGYVQLTGRANYAKAGRLLGIDLTGHPELALDPGHAAAILVRGCSEGWFTGKRLGDFADFVNMRRVVNGVDKAEEIAGLAHVFLVALRSAESAPAPVPVPPPAAARPDTGSGEIKGPLGPRPDTGSQKYNPPEGWLLRLLRALGFIKRKD